MEQCLFNADRLYIQWKEVSVSLKRGIANATKPAISEEELQRFLLKFKRSDSWQMLREQFSENNSGSSAFATRKLLELATKKSPVLLPAILARLLKLRPRSGRSQAGSKDIDIIRPPGSSLNTIAEFLFAPKTMERVITPIISDLQAEYCETLAAHRKIKAGWVRLRQPRKSCGLPRLFLFNIPTCKPSNIPTFGFPYLLPSSVSRKSFSCHLPKHRGCGGILPILVPVRKSAMGTRHFIQVLSSHIFAHSFALFCAHERSNSFLFKRFPTHRSKTAGLGSHEPPATSFAFYVQLSIEDPDLVGTVNLLCSFLPRITGTGHGPRPTFPRS